MLFHPARWGVHRSADLAERGIDKHRLAKLVAAGELERIRPGVFVARPHPAEPDQRWRQLCAVALASAGPDAVLAKQAAAAALQLDGFDPPVPISVNVPTGSGRRGSGIHRRRPLDDPLVVGGLPVTSVAQTLAELGDGLTGRRMNGPAGRPGPLVGPIALIEHAVESALRRYLVDEATLQEVVHLQPLQRPGIAALRDAVERRGLGTVPTESYLETRGVQVLRAAGLPTGVRQHPVFDDANRFVARVDLLLPGAVIVEFDGRAHHGAERFDADRRRWSTLAALGFKLAVFTFDHVEFQPSFVARTVEALVA